MSDPAIKLFGKTIALPSASEEGGGDDTCKVTPPQEETKDKEQDSPKSQENLETITSTSADDDEKSEEQPNEEKRLKKPNKILHCPRCNSMDTKFCYYNNYNVNQPRHFCKNCQRYWTAGGTMRSVPVGAGRRKNKNSTYGHLTVSDATLQAALKTNGTVLNFGSDTPICESMPAVLNLSDKARMNCNRNEEQSTGSSATTTTGSSANLHELMIQNYQGFSPHFPYINGSPWPYPWSPPPIQFYPAPAYWGCGNWGMPWFSPPSPIISTGSSMSRPLSPTLGKHSREGNVLSRDNNHKLWIPKTLRIDDPEEAAKSSIWATMGFKKDKDDDISCRGGLFKSFETKAGLNNHKVDANTQVFFANPAALSRSFNFQESNPENGRNQVF